MHVLSCINVSAGVNDYVCCGVLASHKSWKSVCWSPEINLHHKGIFSLCVTYDSEFPTNVLQRWYSTGDLKAFIWTRTAGSPAVTYSLGLVDHLCSVWFMPGTSLPVETDVCVCCPSSSVQMSVKWSPCRPAACHSQFRDGQVCLVTLESKNTSRLWLLWLLHIQLWRACQNLKDKALYVIVTTADNQAAKTTCNYLDPI